MTSMNYTRILMLTAATLLGGVTLQAESTIARMRANVPFGFQVAGAAMPAGEYEVIVTPNAGGNYVDLRNMDSQKTVRVMAQGSQTGSFGAAAIRFHCANQRCALAGVEAGNGAGYKVPGAQSKAAPDAVQAGL